MASKPDKMDKNTNKTYLQEREEERKQGAEEDEGKQAEKKEGDEQWPWSTGREPILQNNRGIRNLARRGGARANPTRAEGGITKKIKVEPSTGMKRKRSLRATSPARNPPPRVRLAMRRTCGMSPTRTNQRPDHRPQKRTDTRRSPAPFPRDHINIEELRNLTLEASTEPLPATPAASVTESELPDLVTPNPPTPPRGRPQGREEVPNPTERRCGRVRDFSPDRDFMLMVLEQVQFQFSGIIPRERRRRVLGQLEDELRRIHANIPWLDEGEVLGNLIQHGREQLRDGWLRSNNSGIWYLTERTEEELRDPRVRAREEEEYQRRITEPIVGGMEELARRRGELGEVRYQQERFQLMEEARRADQRRNVADRQAEWQRERQEVRRDIMRREEERLVQEERLGARQYIDDAIIGVMDQLAENRELIEDYHRIYHGRGQGEDFPGPLGVGDEFIRDREARRERRRRQKDPVAKLTRMKTANPELMEWRHRLRVYEEILRTANPHNRDHINQILDVEQRRVTEDARAIMRFKGIAGLSTEMDISWPPKNEVHVSVDPGQSDSETDTEDEGRGGDPPAHCRRYRSPRGRNRDFEGPDRRGGRGGAQLTR